MSKQNKKCQKQNYWRIYSLKKVINKNINTGELICSKNVEKYTVKFQICKGILHKSGKIS